MWLLFDDAREGGAAARLYRDPVETIVVHDFDGLDRALERIRVGLREGRHAAGYLAYEAGYAFDPKVEPSRRRAEGPLLCFGLFEGHETPDVESFLPDPDGAYAGPIRPRIGQLNYETAAVEVREHLFAGDFYQANLTFGCDVAVGGSPLALFARLRRSALAGWSGLFVDGDDAIISLSPEQFFTIKDGVIEARPMKGTAARLADAEADRAAANQLATDEKQRAENLMIVDLMRNDLARVAVAGSVEVPELFSVETYPTVHQMVSRITARLRIECDAIDVIRTIFPCGSVTGAPKIAAMKALSSLEPEPRGAYTGSMGWIEPNRHGEPGNASFNVLIRTLEWRAGSTKARLGLGSGLVVDSIPRDEWAECLLKGDFVRRESQSFDLIETMGFDPSEGIIELERHLDRMKCAAADLDFKFDRHAARNELQAATFGRKHRAMVRLLLSRSGSMAIQVKRYHDPEELPVEVAVRPLPVDPSDFRLRYKTTDRRFLDEARQGERAYETIFTDPDGRLTEGSRTNIFVERGGKLLTPPLTRGIMPGILRAKLIEEGRAEEVDLMPDDLSGGFFIGNIVRGLIPAKLA
jgi:para-aminobenzoate synthetase/4-amino-4-deoxychorismate lyase